MVKLTKLFDYQKFEQNEHLESLISETESRTGKNIVMLDDSSLIHVNAGTGIRTPGGRSAQKNNGDLDE